MSQKFKTFLRKIRKNRGTRNGISQECFEKYLDHCQDIMFRDNSKEEHLIWFHALYKVQRYNGKVSNPHEFIQKRYDKLRGFGKNRLDNFFSRIGFFVFRWDYDQYNEHLVDLTGKLYGRIHEISDYFDLDELPKDVMKSILDAKSIVSKKNDQKDQYKKSTSDNNSDAEEGKITVGNLNVEQTNELWKLCNLRIFKYCTKSEFISSFQIENDFTLNYTTKSALYAFCPFIEKSSLYAYCDKELILNKILERFEIKKEDYSKNAIRKPNINHSEKEKEIYQSLHDFFVSYKLI